MPGCIPVSWHSCLLASQPSAAHRLPVDLCPLTLPHLTAIDADQQTAFNPLDSDGQGYLDGQLQVTVELVQC